MLKGPIMPKQPFGFVSAPDSSGRARERKAAARHLLPTDHSRTILRNPEISQATSSEDTPPAATPAAPATSASAGDTTGDAEES